MTAGEGSSWHSTGWLKKKYKTFRVPPSKEKSSIEKVNEGKKPVLCV